ncbi:3-oxoacyl-[acyl-carrier-protein] reductase [Thermotalea metallivorans]|uniref:3-oxoacyl-[acyl-carrier-protein] reductase n=1 Tax=Thermotalea metallivorans TaxID=520762 RepID=A0A140L7A8_9FIRM|nr:3-oxoacyl-[acyl-carrier-protein] reductase [Thermotalea metallivorans]KXG76433.1 3-oxoacyl-[acyl-carrier-protein] reductase FabG [Thermotalea metallivorans]
MDLKGKVALITGGSRGIGRAIALEMGRAGADVVICFKNDVEAAMHTVEAVNAYGVQCLCLRADVKDHASLGKTVNEVINRFGRIDILVNNAGITRDNLLAKMDKEQWDEVLDNNLNSVFYCIKSVLPHMKKRKYGKIINVASLGAFVGNMGQANYCAAKAAIVGFTKSLAAEVGRDGIYVNAVGPGCIETDMLMQIPDKVIQKMRDKIPMKRLGRPEDVASVVLFLASDESNYIVGQTVIVDGGLQLAVI